MSFEGGATPEQIREAHIINELRDVPPEDMMNALHGEQDSARAISPDKISEYLSWELEWVPLIDAIEDPIEQRRQELKRDIARTDIYINSGMDALALRTLEDALTVASQEGFDDAVQEIQEKLDSLQ